MSSNKTSIVAIANQKGGCAKTTTVVSLASAFSKLKKKVLVVDFDFQGNAGDWFGVTEEALESERTVSHAIQKGLSIADVRIESYDENIDVIVSDISLNWIVRKLNGTSRQFQLLKRILECPEIEEYDIVLVDSHPSIDPLFESILNYAHYFIVPVFAEKHPYSGLEYLTQAVEQIQEDINPMLSFLGVVITRFSKKNATHCKFEKKIRELEKVTNIPVFKSVIPTSEAVASASAHQTSLLDYDSNLPISKAYIKLAKELLPMLKGKKTGRPKKMPKIKRARGIAKATVFEDATF